MDEILTTDRMLFMQIIRATLAQVSRE